MHCEDPTCAEVCPADAIKQTEDGIVQSALKPRCIGCSNCVLACPFGVPKYMAELDQMMKCDMCYDRTSDGLAPMCASVCPSEALWFGTTEEFSATRDRLAAPTTSCSAAKTCGPRCYTVVDDAGAGPIDVARAHVDALARRSVRPRRPEVARDDGRARRSRRRGGATSRTRPRPRTTSPVASSPATSCSASAPSPPATSASRRGRRCAPINTGEPRADRRARRRRRSAAPTSSGTRPTTTRRSWSASPTARCVAFSQKCTHLGCVVYYEADEERWHCPCHEGNFDARTGEVISRPTAAAARPHRRRGPRRRHDLGARAAET